MSVQVEKLENSTVKLTIEVPAEQFDAAMQDVYNRQKKNISIPGFRKGKVPRQMVERMYGPEVFYDDAANQIMPQAYSDAAKESGEDIMSRPTVDIVQIEKGKPFIFTAEVAVRPDVKLGEYKGVEVTKIDTEVSDEEVETELNNERERNARTITVEDRAIQSGDTAVIDFEGFADGKAFEGGKGENHNLEIGSGSFIPGFEDQLIGKNSGDEVEVNVTFPEDYHAEDLKGKDAVFKVKIHEVKAKELPEADDEFAQDVSEFDTIAEYRDSIRKKQEAIDKIVEASEMELPDAIVLTRADEIINQFAQQLAQQGLSMDQYMQYAGTDIDQLRDSVRPEAVTRIKNQLVIDAIAKAENIEITDAEVEEELKKMAEMYNMELDKLKGYMTEEETENMKLDLASQKALDLVYDNAVFVDAPEEEKTEEAEAEAAEE